MAAVDLIFGWQMKEWVSFSLEIPLLSGTRSLGLDLEVSVALTGTGGLNFSRIARFSSFGGSRSPPEPLREPRPLTGWPTSWGHC